MAECALGVDGLNKSRGGVVLIGIGLERVGKCGKLYRKNKLDERLYGFEGFPVGLLGVAAMMHATLREYILQELCGNMHTITTIWPTIWPTHNL